MEIPRNQRLLERLFSVLDWPPRVRNHPDFPVRDLKAHVDLQGSVMISYRIGKEAGSLSCSAKEYPSADMVASFELLAGPIDEIRGKHRDEVKRLEAWLKRKHERRDKLRRR